MAWISEIELPFKGPTLFNIHALADWQLGSESTDKRIIKRKVAEIAADPHALWCFLGDIEDDDRPSTRARRRSSFADRPEVPAADAKKHRAWIEKEVLPIMAPLVKRPCLGVLAGHHWTQLERGTNSVQYICAALSAMGKEKVPYLGQMSAWVWLHFIRRGVKHPQSFRRLVHIQHGAGGGQAVGGSLRKLEVASQRLYADAYIRAHSCALEAMKYDVVKPKPKRIPRSGEPAAQTVYLEHRTVPLLNVGSATRAYNVSTGDPTYTEAAMMRPLTMGWGILKARVRIDRLADAHQNPTVYWNIEI